MKRRHSPVTILMADDDPDDCFLVQEALVENRLANHLHFVKDGEELMDYLYHRGHYADSNRYPQPGLILLDLNMPKKDGRESLQEIKSNPHLKHIPIIVLTTFQTEEEVHLCYALGANSLIAKPANFGSLVEVIKVLTRYWFEIVELPSEGNDAV